jgi:hypothetical protein
MHIDKNICDNLLDTLLKLEWKTKDIVNARLDLTDMSIRPHLHYYQDGNMVKTPQAFYVLKPAQQSAFCKFLNGIKSLEGYVANLGRYIAPDGSKLQGDDHESTEGDFNLGDEAGLRIAD